MSNDTPVSSIEAFVKRWAASGASERANYGLFLAELCAVLEVPSPEPTKADEAENAYVFEKAVTFQHGDGSTSSGRIDLYKRGCFVLEAKQGSQRQKKDHNSLIQTPKKGRKGTAVRGTQGWDDAMLAARGQAEQYARALPSSEGRPPFLVVIDVGYSIELYSEFSRSGGTYVPFPDARHHRILLADLEKKEARQRLREVWTDPMALDPSRRSAKITREVAARLATLAKSLESSGYEPERVSGFLMRAIFTMFAEDVGMLPVGSFTKLLEGLRGNVGIFPDMIGALWVAMAEGGFSPTLRQKLLRFNGGLFESAEALPLTEEQLEFLIDASKSDWKEVEPAIFGTLLERALNPKERHKLGAHYTPRAYVERLVLPTVIEPLREEWHAVQAAAVTLAKAGKLDEARAEVRSFHEKLCQVRVLDPACGSGNFLYVTLELMKRLEGEILRTLEDFGELQHTLITVDPHQLLGIEINPRAAAIADLVLWIGFLQWHFRTAGDVMPQEPVLKRFHNVENRDAVLTYDRIEPAKDDAGRPITRWNGYTYKRHHVTGEEVPDERAQRSIIRYVNPHEAEWPQADYIVGNPPFLGKLHLLSTLTEEYVQALRETYKDKVSDGADFVMHWWYRAAKLVSKGSVKKFGLITTSSITNPINRGVVLNALEGESPIHLAYAVPDHPWVDESGSAAVRIAMTVGELGEGHGTLAKVISEGEASTGDADVKLEESTGLIHADLRVGANVVGARPLQANSSITSTGLILGGRGFVLTAEESRRYRENDHPSRRLIYPLQGGRDLTDTPREIYVIDTDGWEEEELRTQAPDVYQRLLERVYPERQLNRDPRLRAKWWLYRRSNEGVRAAIAGLPRYIATTATSKHRVFTFLRGSVMPENTIIVIALDDAFYLGVLSSRIHVLWSVRAGTRLGIGNDPRYIRTRCFDPFPFPACDEPYCSRIRVLGEQLDAHRKHQQAQHPRLTVTEIYNVLEKLRAQEPLTDREKVINEQGLVSTLRKIHDDLDAAVFAAYGWPVSLDDDALLEGLVNLNEERAQEERAGQVRWLRPEFQSSGLARQGSLDTDVQDSAVDASTKVERLPWPRSLAEQAKAVRAELAAQGGVVTPEELAKSFARAKIDRVQELLETLVSLGQAREVEAGKFVA